MKHLLDGVKDLETLNNLHYLCLDIIGKSNECSRHPAGLSLFEGCPDLELQYNNGIEKNKEFVKKFNNLLQNHKELLSVGSFCNNNIEQNQDEFKNFINLLILRLEEKGKKYKILDRNYFSGQIIFNYIKMYTFGNDIKYIPKTITTKIRKLIVQSLPAYSLGSTPSTP